MNTDFVPGELPVYEKYNFEKKRTCFGLMKIVSLIVGIFADRDIPDHWQGVFTEIQIHRDRLILRQHKKFWIPLTPWLKKYGRKTHVLPFKDVNALVKNGENLFTLKFGGQEFEFSTQDNFNPEGLLHNLRTANPQIRFTGI
ncbi:MAG: hypothetical protein IKT98_06060 [Selenomonadaceae bacterium]|nr:hypothetical protein [Selenomonadaceae bacterium]